MYNPWDPSTPQYAEFQRKYGGQAEGAGGASAAPPTSPVMGAAGQGAEGSGAPPPPAASTTSGPEGPEGGTLISGGVPRGGAVEGGSDGGTSGMNPAQSIPVVGVTPEQAKEAAAKAAMDNFQIPMPTSYGGTLVKGGRMPHDWVTEKEKGLEVPIEVKGRVDSAEEQGGEAIRLERDATEREIAVRARAEEDAAWAKRIDADQDRKRLAERTSKEADIDAKVAEMSKLKPEDLWTDGRKFAVALGALAAGIAAGRGVGDGTNQVLKQVESQINADMAARREKMGAVSNELKRLHAGFANEDAAIAAERAARLGTMQAQVEEWLVDVKNDKARARAASLLEGLATKQAEARLALAKTEQDKTKMQVREVQTPDRVVGGGVDTTKTFLAIQTKDPSMTEAKMAESVKNIMASTGQTKAQALATLASAYNTKVRAPGAAADNSADWSTEQQRLAHQVGKDLAESKYHDYKMAGDWVKEIALTAKPGERPVGFTPTAKFLDYIGAERLNSTKAQNQQQAFAWVNAVLLNAVSGAASSVREDKRIVKVLRGEGTREDLLYAHGLLNKIADTKLKSVTVGLSPEVKNKVVADSVGVNAPAANELFEVDRPQ